jgi:hypothetical protein
VKRTSVKNTQAYYGMELFTAVKRFMVQFHRRICSKIFFTFALSQKIKNSFKTSKMFSKKSFEIKKLLKMLKHNVFFQILRMAS